MLHRTSPKISNEKKRSNERKFKANKNDFKKYVKNNLRSENGKVDWMCTFEHADAFTENKLLEFFESNRISVSINIKLERIMYENRCC